MVARGVEGMGVRSEVREVEGHVKGGEDVEGEEEGGEGVGVAYSDSGSQRWRSTISICRGGEDAKHTRGMLNPSIPNRTPPHLSDYSGSTNNIAAQRNSPHR